MQVEGKRYLLNARLKIQITISLIFIRALDFSQACERAFEQCSVRG
jgi:hypothetical protein